MRTSLYFAAVIAAGLALLHAAPQPAGRGFATAQEAAKALVDAAAQNDTAALLKIFGPAGRDIVESGDAAEDKAGRAHFTGLAHAKMVVAPEPGNPDRATVIVGPEDWPFPIPLIRQNGQWWFDTAAGRVEVLARRVGRNELTAIDVCRGYVEAQMEYAAQDRNGDGVLQYAQKMAASPGKKDGLYWEGESGSPVSKSFADAAAAMSPDARKPAPYHGYFFRMLKAQGPDAPGGAMDYVVNGKMIGGFALVAYPAEYGVSGIKTFLVGHQGIVYEKDLGAATATLARQMTRFNPDKTWRAVEGE
ncbi:MAG TPA: DUF2950 domain-containing protein [Bryobacteraceae bacterium]|nr:DUF2950 domain-containing protein [Bryobacteraceae bacterium]